MSFDPQASRLVLLKQLATEEQGAKLRFLGCVHEYHAKDAVLTLVEKYPVLRSNAVVNVNISNVLESISFDLTETGSWINVTGYIRKLESSSTPKHDTSIETKRSKKPRFVVDAITVWSAGAIKLDAYIKTVQAIQKG